MHLNIWYVLLVAGRSGRTLLLILLTLRLLSSRMPYDVSLFIAQIFVGCGNISFATTQTLRKTTCERTYRVDTLPRREGHQWAHRCYSPSIQHLQSMYLAWTIVSSVDCCLRMAGTCFLAVASSFSRDSAHLRGLLYLSSENKRTEDIPESADEGRNTEARGEENTGVSCARVKPSRDSTRAAGPARRVVRINNGAHRCRIVIGVYLPNVVSARGIALAHGKLKCERAVDATSRATGDPGRAFVPSPIYSLVVKLRERSRVVSVIIFDKLVHSTCPHRRNKKS